MRQYSLFDAATGDAIGQGGIANMAFDSVAEPGQVIFEGHYVRTHYYDPTTEELVEKTDMGTSIDVQATLPGETVTISNVPVGTKAEVGDDEVIVDDGVLTLTTVDEGRYVIYLTHREHLPVNYEVFCDDGS